MTKNNAGGASTRLADPQIPIHLRAVDDQSTVPIQNRPRQPRQASVRRLCEKCQANCLEVHAEQCGHGSLAQAIVRLSVDLIKNRVDFQGVVALYVLETVGPGSPVR